MKCVATETQHAHRLSRSLDSLLERKQLLQMLSPSPSDPLLGSLHLFLSYNFCSFPWIEPLDFAVDKLHYLLFVHSQHWSLFLQQRGLLLEWWGVLVPFFATFRGRIRSVYCYSRMIVEFEAFQSLLWGFSGNVQWHFLTLYNVFLTFLTILLLIKRYF